MINFQINKKHLSQIPVLQLLIGLGFECLTSDEARFRGSKSMMRDEL